MALHNHDSNRLMRVFGRALHKRHAIGWSRATRSVIAGVGGAIQHRA